MGNLSGVRVLDLSRVLAGPLCSMMLGDLGADVIKVERPGSGDDTRGWGPPFAEDGQSAYFRSVNRNKRSVALDFALEADRTVILELIRGADVVIENFLPGVLARYGIDSDLLMAENTQLLWCTISGFGTGNPRPGYDFVVQAESGWMAITGEPTGEPMKVGVALADVIAGKDAAIGILAALVARRGSAAPLPAPQRRVEVALASSATAALVNVAQNALVAGVEPARWGNAHPNLVPYQLFHAADRPLVVAVGTDAQWRALTGVLALDDLGADPALATNAGRVTERVRVVAALAARFPAHSAADWCAWLDAVGVPCGLVRGVREALADVTASAQTGVPPLMGGTIRHSPPDLDADGVSVREKRWDCFS